MVGWFLASFISADLQVALGKLADFRTYAYSSISDVDNKLQNLRRTLTTVQSQSIHNDEQRARAWEDLSYDAADLIDEIEIAISKLEAAGHGNLVNNFVSSLSKRTSGAKISEMQTQLNELLDNIGRYWESERKFENEWYEVSASRQTTSLVDNSRVFDRVVEKEEVINLCKLSSANNLSIIPIVGMIGVGKTTLAQLVYNSGYGYEFHKKMWVSVTYDASIMSLTRSIIEATGGESTSHLLNLDSIQLRLIEILRDKRFLLVLDDWWNEKQGELEVLLTPLYHGLGGSKIIATTRSRNTVSSLDGVAGPYQLKCLSDDDFWLLLKKQAFGNVPTSINPKLEAIGKKIARKCKGFPLGAKNIGRLLRKKIDEGAWNDILESQIWSVQNEAVGVLRSSFWDHLPSHLKDCFSYCSIFPQRYEFEKNKLVRMWMGEGFIRPGEEDLGREYFDELFRMTIFSLESEKYQMNEAVHDLAQLVCGEKFCRMEETHGASLNPKTRYLSLVFDEINRKTIEAIQRKTFGASYMCKGVRTFLLFSERIFKEVPFELFLKLGRLRVLDLSHSQLEELATSIGNLKHLRFLDLSNTFIKLLPDEVQELSLLQTLKLVNCPKLLCLPKGTTKLISLQHLELCRINKLTSMPYGIGRLTSLQTLSQFIVGPKSGQMKELKDMNNIRGSLCIKQLEKVSNPEEALEANLAKKCIEELELQWNSPSDARKDEHVLGNLMTGPHATLKRLTMQGYAGRMLPGWVSDQSSKLTNIFLKDCRNCKVLPPLGQLPNLKSLKLEGMHELEKVEEDFCGEVAAFPALESLEFRNMLKLESWVGVRDEDMACLHKLTVAKCPKIVTLPLLHYFKSLQKLEFENCPRLPSLSEERLSSSIKYLTIIECPIIKERWEKAGGEDWIEIQHIPDIEIDYEKVRGSDS